MKKFLTLLVGTLFAWGSAVAQNYATNYDASARSTHNDRYPSGVSVESSANGMQNVTWASGAKHLLFTDATATEVTVAAEEEITLRIQLSGSWLNSYAYIDLNHDGTFDSSVDETNHKAKADGELVAWSFYSFAPETSEDPGYNSQGTSISGNERNTVALPKFKAPATVGTYRMRVKIDWNSIDPKGSTSSHLGGSMQANGGGIIDFTLKVVEASATGGGDTTPTTLQLNQSTGAWGSTNAAGTWAASWTSNATDPGVSFGCAQNNMAYNTSGEISCYTGTVTPDACPYHITAQEGYVVTDYEFDVARITTSSSFAIVPDGMSAISVPSNGTTTHVAVHGLNSRMVSFTLTSSGGNAGVQLSAFTVTLKKSSTKEEKKVIFVYDKTPGQNVVYRIPSIASMPNGRVVAFTDYRPGGADVGGGEVDIHAKYSDDYGQTWSNEIVVVNGLGNDSQGKRYFSFGDPVSIADRESGKLMMVSCSGHVMYPSATRSNHQGVEVFYSEDGGATWTQPVDVSEQIYSQLDAINVQSLFVGSGGFVQSKFVKKGDYYRIYGGILCRTSSAGGINYAIYSDDFGKTWHVLGGYQAKSITSGGDEAKVEELPDGSVLHSSRCNGGRIFNIWHWDDATFETGSWGTQAGSNASNNGVIASGNACNGEIRIVPAKRVADNKCVYLALQSIPFGGGRANVGIFWKELASVNDFDSPATFAANWNGRYQVSFLGSAYSAMVLQKDGNIGFLVEEETYAGCGYSEVYHNLSYETITNGLYTFKSDTDADFDRSPFGKNRYSVTYKLYWDNQLRETTTVSGYEGDAFPQPDVPPFCTAQLPTGTFNASVAGKTYEVRITPDPDAPLHFCASAEEALYGFLYILSANQYITDSHTTSINLTSNADVKLTEAASAWAFIGNPYDGFQILNSNGKYLTTSTTVADGNTGGSTFPYTQDLSEVVAGRTDKWEISRSSYGEEGFFLNIKGNPNARLNFRTPYLAYWTGGADLGSTFQGKDLVQTKTLTIEMDGKRYATVCYPYDVQLPDDCNAYTMVWNPEKPQLHAVEIHRILPANTPAMVEGTSTSIDVLLAKSLAVAPETTGVLLGTNNALGGTAAPSGKLFVLAKDDDHLAFVQAMSVPANTAYVSVDASVTETIFPVSFEPILVNGIHATESAAPAAQYFDLQGRALQQLPRHGVVVTSQGKKVVLK